MSTPPSLSRSSSRNSQEIGSSPGVANATESQAKSADKANPTTSTAVSTPVPTLNTPRQTNGDIVRAWTAFRPNPSKDLAEQRSEPMLSPRGHRRDPSLLLSPRAANYQGVQQAAVGSAAVATTTTTTNTTTTTTTTTTATATTLAMASSGPTASTATTATPKRAAKSTSDRVLDGAAITPALDKLLGSALSNKGVMEPESLGKLLVAVESNETRTKMVEGNTDTILRGGLKIESYQASGGNPVDINVIEQMCVPFMRAHLKTPEYAQILGQMTREFDKVADEVNELCSNLRPAQMVKNPTVSKLMQPVVTAFADKFCGKERCLASSGLPDPMKRLLMSIDNEVIRWFEQSGSGQPRDLYNARRNALVNFLSTRSIMPIWMAEIKEKYPDPGQYQKMTAYLNSYMAHAIDDFIMDVLIAQPEQSSSQKGYVERLAGRKQLLTKDRPSKLKLSVSPSLVFNQRSLQSMGGGTPTLALSPRSRFASVEDAKAAEKIAKMKGMERSVERAQLVDRIALTSGLDKLDHALYMSLKESIVHGTVRGFDNFKRDPISLCIGRAKKWYAQPENAQIARSDVPGKVLKSLESARSTFPTDPSVTFRRLNLEIPSNPFDDIDDASIGEQGGDMQSPRASSPPSGESATDSSETDNNNVRSSEKNQQDQ